LVPSLHRAFDDDGHLDEDVEFHGEFGGNFNMHDVSAALKRESEATSSDDDTDTSDDDKDESDDNPVVFTGGYYTYRRG
jgi:hypothetical protein